MNKLENILKNKKLLIIITVLVVIMGVFIKVYYIDYTEHWQRQHDVISFGAEEGHAAYIEYILNNNSLPDFDPREKWGFFQPPLHHILSAGMMKISLMLGMDYKTAGENVQVLTCLYMLIVMAVTYLFCREFKLKPFSTLLVMALSGLHPLFTLLSGSINNDALSLCLAYAALYTAALWYKKPDVLRSVILAFLIGLSMFAKLTGALVAPGIGILMLIKMFQVIKNKDKKDTISIIRNFIIFIVIVAPIGLYWTIRNCVKWHMPVSYIPPVGEQFPENITLFERLFDFTNRSPFVALISYGDTYDEHNVFLALFKTSLFGEYDFSEYSGRLKLIGFLILALSLILALVSLLFTVTSMKDKALSLNFEVKLMLLITYIVYIVSYMSFALSYSNFSAQDFRYGAICILIQSLFLGMGIENLKNKKLKLLIGALVLLFALLSFMMYFIIGLKS